MKRPAVPPTHASTTHATNQSDDTLGNGIESGVVLVIFCGLGFLLDRRLGTAPLLTIGLFAIGAVGLFYRLKYTYTTRMDELARERREAMNRGVPR